MSNTPRFISEKDNLWYQEPKPLGQQLLGCLIMLIVIAIVVWAFWVVYTTYIAGIDVNIPTTLNEVGQWLMDLPEYGDYVP